GDWVASITTRLGAKLFTLTTPHILALKRISACRTLIHYFPPSNDKSYYVRRNNSRTSFLSLPEFAPALRRDIALDRRAFVWVSKHGAQRAALPAFGAGSVISFRLGTFICH